MKIDSKVPAAFGVVFAHTISGLTYFNQWGAVVLVYYNSDTYHKGAVNLSTGNVYAPTHGELFRPVKTRVVLDES